jgi:hypothetical protein
MNAYQIKYTGKTYHIAGIEVATVGTQLDYSITACPALTRSASRMAITGKPVDDLAAALKSATTSARVRNGKVCAHCEKAAAKILAA